MEKLAREHAGWTNWPIALTLFAAAIASYAVYYNVSEPLKSLAGDQQILDMRASGYNLSEARELLESIGQEGRSLYFRTTLLDTVWPGLLAVSSVFFSGLAFRAKWLIVAVALFPVAFGLLDAFENMGILVMLSTYPDISTFWVNYCETITRVKWFVIPVAFPIFLALPLVALARLLVVARWRSTRSHQ